MSLMLRRTAGDSEAFAVEVVRHAAKAQFVKLFAPRIHR
jgi:hypothetical protein